MLTDPLLGALLLGALGVGGVVLAIESGIRFLWMAVDDRTEDAPAGDDR